MTSVSEAAPSPQRPSAGRRALHVLYTAESVLAGLVLVLLVGITFVGVVMRYALHAPFVWLIEMQLAGMVWIAFLASSIAFRYKAHVAIEIVVDLLPKRAQAVMGVLIGLIVYVLLGFLFYSSIVYLQNFVTSGRSTPILRIPYYIVYGIAPLSCVLMAISYTTTEFVTALRGLRPRTSAPDTPAQES